MIIVIDGHNPQISRASLLVRVNYSLLARSVQDYTWNCWVEGRSITLESSR